jgi:hypothetical protein
MSLIDEQELDLQLGEAREQIKQLRQELAEQNADSPIWKQASKLYGPYVYSAFHPRTKRKPKKLKSLSGLGEALL